MAYLASVVANLARASWLLLWLDWSWPGQRGFGCLAGTSWLAWPVSWLVWLGHVCNEPSLHYYSGVLLAVLEVFWARNSRPALISLASKISPPSNLTHKRGGGFQS